jgi:hypothetical protein
MLSLIRFALLVVAGLFASAFLGGAGVLLAMMSSHDLSRVPLAAALTAIGAAGAAACFVVGNRLKRREVAAAAITDTTTTQLRVHARWLWLGFFSVFLTVVATFVIAYAAAKPGHQAIGAAVALVFFAAVAWLLSLAMFRGFRPALVLDRSGFDHVFFGNLRWEDIDGMSLQSDARKANTQLLVGVADRARHAMTGSWLGRRYIKRTRRDGQEQMYLQIPMNLLDARPERIVDVAKTLRAQVSPPMIDVWIHGMTVEDITVRRECDYLNENMPRIIDDLARRLHDDPLAFDAEAKRQVSAHLAMVARNQERFLRAHRAAFGG